MLLLIAGIIQAIMSVTCLGLMIALLNEVNESSYYKDKHVSCTSDSDGGAHSNPYPNPSQVSKGWCDDYFKKCDTDDSGISCSDKSGADSWYDTTSDSVCFNGYDTSADYR